MRPLVRYLVADLAHSQRWAAPAVAYLVLLAIVVGGGAPLPSLAIAAFALFPIGAWLTWVAVGCEDPLQEGMTATAAGGLGRVRLAKALTGALTAVSLGALPFALTAARVGLDAGTLAAAAMAILANVAGGTALGLACAPPLLPRRGLAVIAVVLVSLLELIVPWAPPGRATLQVLNDGGHLVLRIGLTAVVTILVSAVIVRAAIAVTLRRA